MLCVVSSDGGRAMAASTALPSTSGNSERMVSYTIPAYEPALCPRMERAPTMYPVNVRRSTGRISGRRDTPTSGCATNNLVKSRRPCMHPGHGGFLCDGPSGAAISFSERKRNR